MRAEEDLEQLYRDCVEFWGADRQIRMLQEECGELIVASSHYLRLRETGLDEIIEELADVQLMVNQIKMFIGEEKVKDMMDVKSDYIKRELEEEKEISQWNLES